MILQEVDESERRKMRAGLAARRFAERRMLALIGEALREAAPEVIDGIGSIVRVVTVALAGQSRMHGVVEIVVPLRVVIARRAAAFAFEQIRLVLVVLEHEMDVPARASAARLLRQRFEEMRLHVIVDRVDRVEAQPVEMIFRQPIKRILDEETPGDAAEIERLAPTGLAFREEARGIEGQIIPLGPEMIVDDIEKNHDA